MDRDSEKLGGAWCFAETRMPVESLFGHLDRGSIIEEFLECFPAVIGDQVHQVMRFAKA